MGKTRVVPGGSGGGIAGSGGWTGLNFSRFFGVLCGGVLGCEAGDFFGGLATYLDKSKEC